MKKVVLLILFALMLTCGEKSAGDAAASKYGGILINSSISDPKSFNEIIAKETSTTAAIGFLFEGLTKTNGITTEVQPCLSTNWKFSNDGLIWTFYLRKNVQWFDGKPFTADDVVFTYNNLIYNEDIPASARDIFTIDGEKVKVEKIDNYTVRFILPKPFAPLLRQLGQSILPKHVLGKAVKAGKFNSIWGVNTIPSKIIGTGPFMISEFKPSQRLVYVRNPNYWQKDKQGNQLPYLDKIVTLIVENQNVQLALFKSKEIDILGIREKDFAYLKKRESMGNYKVYNCGPAFGTNFVVFNQNYNYVKSPKIKWFTDLQFRKAVAHSIDKQTIINNVMAGIGFPQHAAMEKAAVSFYNPNVRQYNYDITKAKEILKKAGYIDRDRDGIVEDKQGNKVKFTMLTNAGNDVRKDIGSIISTDLKKIGLDVTFTPIDFNNLVNRLSSTFDWDAILIGLTGGIEPHFGKNVWESCAHLHMWNPKPNDEDKIKIWEKNLTAWEKEIDKMFNKGVCELNQKKRKVYYDKWQEIVAEQLPLIYTVNGPALYGIRNRFGNIQPSSYGGALHNIEEIYIKK